MNDSSKLFFAEREKSSSKIIANIYREGALLETQIPHELKPIPLLLILQRQHA